MVTATKLAVADAAPLSRAARRRLARFQEKLARFHRRHRDELLWEQPHYAGEPRPEGYVTVPLPETPWPDEDYQKYLIEELGYNGEHGLFSTSKLFPTNTDLWQRAAEMFVRVRTEGVGCGECITEDAFETVIRQSYSMPQAVKDGLRDILIFKKRVADVAQQLGVSEERLKKRAQRIRKKVEEREKLQELIAARAADMAGEADDADEWINDAEFKQLWKTYQLEQAEREIRSGMWRKRPGLVFLRKLWVILRRAGVEATEVAAFMEREFAGVRHILSVYRSRGNKPNYIPGSYGKYNNIIYMPGSPDVMEGLDEAQERKASGHVPRLPSLNEIEKTVGDEE